MEARVLLTLQSYTDLHHPNKYAYLEANYPNFLVDGSETGFRLPVAGDNTFPIVDFWVTLQYSEDPEFKTWKLRIHEPSMAKRQVALFFVRSSQFSNEFIPDGRLVLTGLAMSLVWLKHAELDVARPSGHIIPSGFLVPASHLRLRACDDRPGRPPSTGNPTTPSYELEVDWMRCNENAVRTCKRVFATGGFCEVHDPLRYGSEGIRRIEAA
uniref:Uncharacterized protein n=1 Tax=Mycena chlorophos TaxID=658473 RepID=A0ABQ0L9H6_MYCCL|nr:predicted protein [Mycena chlorophos]